MKIGFKLSGVGPLRKIFSDTQRKATSSSVIVGYTANYALPVHEMVNAVFKAPGTKAKFLEGPARRLQGTLANIVEKSVENGETLSDGLLKAGLRLQRESQKECPIDTGNLKSSAFTRKER